MYVSMYVYMYAQFAISIEIQIYYTDKPVSLYVNDIHISKKKCFWKIFLLVCLPVLLSCLCPFLIPPLLKQILTVPTKEEAFFSRKVYKYLPYA